MVVTLMVVTTAFCKTQFSITALLVSVPSWLGKANFSRVVHIDCARYAHAIEWACFKEAPDTKQVQLFPLAVTLPRSVAR